MSKASCFWAEFKALNYSGPSFLRAPVFLIARTGIEPVRPFTGPGILSPVRLPVSPPGREEHFTDHANLRPCQCSVNVVERHPNSEMETQLPGEEYRRSQKVKTEACTFFKRAGFIPRILLILRGQLVCVHRFPFRFASRLRLWNDQEQTNHCGHFHNRGFLIEWDLIVLFRSVFPGAIITECVLFRVNRM